MHRVIKIKSYFQPLVFKAHKQVRERVCSIQSSTKTTILPSRLSTVPQPTSSAWIPPSSIDAALFHKHSGDGGPTVVINHCALVECFHIVSSRLSHSQLDAHSAEWLMSLESHPPISASSSHCFHQSATDWEQNPLTPTSTGNCQVRHPFSMQRSRSFVYFAFFISLPLSHGTASSMKISFLPDFDYTTMSGRRVVSTISGKTNLFPKSTPMFQPGVSPRIDEPTLRFCNVDCAVCVLHTLRFCNVGCAVCLLLVLPDLTKAICRCWGLLPCSFSHSFSSQSANSLRTESFIHLYLPCVSAVEQDDRICSSVSGLSHRLHLGSAVSLQLHRFARDGSRS